MSSPLFVLAASATEASEWKHSIWQQMCSAIKYPLLRFAGLPDRLLRKHLYLDFTGYKRNPNQMVEFSGEIIPPFQTVRDRGLNMIDASA